MSGTREWDATSYDALPLPHTAWGLRVLDRMGLAGDELVLDAGCGTGRDAAALLERWPNVRVIGLDGSQQMLDQARERLGERATLVRADLTQPLPLPEPVDAVMSVAAFHWIRDHTTLFRNLHAVMKTGASLTTDCGGRGNVAGVNRGARAGDRREPRRLGVRRRRGHPRTTGGRSASRCSRSACAPDPFRCDDPEVLERYLATVVLGSKLDALPESERAGFVTEVRLAMDEPVVDYVRLEIDARAR